MPAKLDQYLDLLNDKKAFAHLATLMPDGSPQVTPVWFDYAGGAIRVNSARGRVKDRNMKEGAAVAAVDPRSRQSLPLSAGARSGAQGDRGRRIGAYGFAR